MWTYAVWNLWAAAPPQPHHPSATELVLARLRHPSFTPDLAEGLVAGLNRRELHRLWHETDRLLEGALEDDARFRLAVLRERLLDRLDPVRDRTHSGR